ncbi:MAG: LCP family protein [Actinomycetota bacterium]|uniref:LCP family protein n=1 Tax=Mycobacterium lentiflavum TaxID=141349 RepID=A0ABY3UUW5_MYCLN|nr:LCP family protein [Mycobacterium lentiflavum]MEE3063644.1 LCP family protein [Actinomycetota bacterium]ULP42378.1 LCP family protein [Mycobacterium lentiflavum]
MNGDRSAHRERRRRPIPPEPRAEPPPMLHRPTNPPPSATDQTVPLPRISPPVSVGAAGPGQVAPSDKPRSRARPRDQSSPPSDLPGVHRKPKKRRWGRVIASTLLTGFLLTVVVVVGGGWWLDTTLHRTTVLTNYPDRPASSRGTNWLLVGSDSRQGLSAEQQENLATGGDVGSSRTDTILLIHIPALGSSNPTTMVSIPRDSFVPIPGHGKDKINSAFAIGGAPLLVQTVEQATGLRLDHYAEIGFSGFAAVVDALGGVTVCPTAPINDPLAGIDLPAGCQKLNGRSALGYVRTRDTPRADLDRMVNQRQFISALLHRAASPSVWLNPWRWYAVPHAAAEALTVDDRDHVWDLARLGWALHGSTTTLTVPIGDFASNSAGSVVVWNHDVAGQLFEALVADSAVPAAALEGQS